MIGKVQDRDWAILGLILLLAFGIFLADVVLLPGVILPGPPYFVPVIVAAYFLPPGKATGVAVFATILRLLSDLAKQTPAWLMILYFVALVIISVLSVLLSAKLRIEAALAEERQRLLDQVEHERQRVAELAARAERRAAELDVSNRELQSFAYSVAHDLRAPARQVASFSQLLLNEYIDKPLDDRGKEYLEFLRNAGQREGQIIDDLLELSRVTRAEMRLQAVNLSQVARSVMEELRSEQPDRQVEFTVAPTVVVEGDPQLLRLALRNLLGNAWKFTSTRPVARIEFGVTKQDGKPVYYVRDNGVGFEMAYVGKLFGAFQRLHRADEFPGTGIGLAIVQRIIQRHGGRVWAEGEVDRGATLRFTLE